MKPKGERCEPTGKCPDFMASGQGKGLPKMANKGGGLLDGETEAPVAGRVLLHMQGEGVQEQ